MATPRELSRANLLGWLAVTIALGAGDAPAGAAGGLRRG
jgi:hypothetical protein